jgi:hypothetical protein
MTRLRQLARLLRITRVFVRHDLDEFVTAIHLFRPYRLLLRLAPWRLLARRNIPRGVRLREALEELGPVFVKFGQMLSTRPDLLPEDIANELAKLQDRVPPFAAEESVRLIEQALGGKLETWFSEFNREPIASASVAQVHIAVLHDGAEVAVKVLRPGIESVIERDLELLYLLASLALRYAPQARRFRPAEVVDEFSKTIHDELDLRVESANASRLRANFEGSTLLHVPKVYWDLTRRTVMVLERIHGIPIGNVEGLKAAGIDMRMLAHNGVEIFFTQAFRDGFFHADMHPGNIFVSPEGQYRAVDFGIMGTLGEKDKRYLAENFLAFFNRDYHAVADPSACRLGGAGHESGGVRGRHPHRLRTGVRPAHQGNFLRPLPAASVPDRAPFQHGSPAAAGAVTEDALQYRGSGPPALSRSRSVGNRQALSGALDERTHGSARLPEQPAQGIPQVVGHAAGNSVTGARRPAACRPNRRGAGSANQGTGRTAPAAAPPAAPAVFRRRRQRPADRRRRVSGHGHAGFRRLGVGTGGWVGSGGGGGFPAAAWLAAPKPVIGGMSAGVAFMLDFHRIATTPMVR